MSTEQTTTPDPAPALGEALDLIRARCWRGAPADLDAAFDVVFGELREMQAERDEDTRVMNVLRRHRDTAEAELARVLPVVDAARAAGQAWGEHDLRAVGPALDDLSAAVAALDGDAAATPQPDAFTFRHTGPRRTGEPADLGNDVAAVETLIAQAPADYPGLVLLRRRRDELIEQIRAATPTTDTTPECSDA